MSAALSEVGEPTGTQSSSESALVSVQVARIISELIDRESILNEASNIRFAAAVLIGNYGFHSGPEGLEDEICELVAANQE